MGTEVRFDKYERIFKDEVVQKETHSHGKRDEERGLKEQVFGKNDAHSYRSSSTLTMHTQDVKGNSKDAPQKELGQTMRNAMNAGFKEGTDPSKFGGNQYLEHPEGHALVFHGPSMNSEGTGVRSMGSAVLYEKTNPIEPAKGK